MIVDFSEHKKHMGFCSSDCFEKALETLLIKDVDWDCLKVQSTKYKVQNNKNVLTYKELRSLVKNEKTSFDDAKIIVQRHLKKGLEDTLFRHKESQKE